MIPCRINQGTVTAVKFPPFLWSVWAQSLRWRADRQRGWSGLASVPLIGMGSGTVGADR